MAQIPIKDANGSAVNFTPAADCIGSPSDTTASSDTGTFSLIALTKRFTGYLASLVAKDFATQTTLAAINTKIPASPATEGGNLATIVTNTGKIPALGQAVMASSAPVTIASNQSAVPVSGTVTTTPPANASSNVAQINGVVPLMGSGVNGTGAQRITLATDQAACTVAGLFSVKVDQTTDGTTNKVESAGLPTVAAVNATTVGLATGLTVVNIKASAGNVYGMAIANKTASPLYIQFYNTAGVPTLGTSVTWWVPVLASQQIFIPIGDVAMANHTTGIGIGASTTPTSTGTPATAPDVVVFYK